MNLKEITFQSLLNLSMCKYIGVKIDTLSNIIESIGNNSQKKYLWDVIIPSLEKEIPDKWQREKYHLKPDIIEMIINIK